jgi:hypothetical protein
MFCDSCGTNLTTNVNFCPSCGKPIRAAGTATTARGRIATHLRIVAILWIVLSMFHLLPALALLSVFHFAGDFFPTEVPFFVHGFVRVFGWIFMLYALVGLIAGWGLLQREHWARPLTILLAFFNLLSIPFGTALGIYTLWVLLPSESEQEYRQMAGAV